MDSYALSLDYYYPVLQRQKQPMFLLLDSCVNCVWFNCIYYSILTEKTNLAVVRKSMKFW